MGCTTSSAATPKVYKETRRKNGRKVKRPMPKGDVSFVEIDIPAGVIAATVEHDKNLELPSSDNPLNPFSEIPNDARKASNAEKDDTHPTVLPQVKSSIQHQAEDVTVVATHGGSSLSGAASQVVDDVTVGASPTTSMAPNPQRLTQKELRAFHDGEDVYDAADDSLHGRVLKLLGTGAMGEVYHVLESSGQNAALKCIKLGNRSKEEVEQITADLLTEAKTLLQLGVHRNLAVLHYVHTLDKMVGDINQRLILLFMECVNGGSLEGLIKRESMSVQELLEISIGIANGLAHMHSHGWIHQDLKPDNVLVTDSKVPKITDYGTCSKLDSDVSRHVVKTGQAGQDVEDVEVVDDRQTVRAVFSGGTPGYWSKEQNDAYVKGEAVLLTRRSDMWSYALTVIQMFARMKFWRRGELGQSILQHYVSHIDKGTTHAGAGQPNMQSIPDPVLMPARLVELLHQCLEPNEADRPQSMDVIISTLVEVLRSECGVEYVCSSEDEAVRSIDKARLYKNLGIAYQRVGKFDDALLTYEEGRLKYPSASDWNYLLGELYRAQKQYEKSLEYYEEGLKQHADDVMCRNGAGLAYLRLNQLDKAADQFEAGIALAPNDFVLHNSLGMIHLSRKHHQEALKSFLRALEIKPNSPSPLFNAGYCYYQMEQYDEALAYFEQLCNTSPGHTDYWYFSGQIYCKRGAYQEAIKRFRRAYEMDSSNVERYGAIFDAFLEVGDCEEAYRFAMELVPKVADWALLYKFGIRLCLDAIQRGLEVFKSRVLFFDQRLCELEPEWRNVYGYALRLAVAKRHEECEQVLGQYIETHPAEVEAYLTRADCRSEAEAYELVEQDYNTVGELLQVETAENEAQRFDLSLRRGQLCRLKKDTESALSWFAKALSVTKDSTLQAQAYFERGRCYLSLGNVKGLLEEFQRAYESDNTKQLDCLKIAQFQASHDNYELAMLVCGVVQAKKETAEYARKTWQQDVGNERAAYRLINYLIEVEQYEDAKEMALQMVEKRTPMLWAFEWLLVTVYERLGQSEEVIRQYERVISLCRSDSSLNLSVSHLSASYRLGRELVLKARSAEAKPYLKEAVEHGVKEVDCFVLLCKVLVSEGTEQSIAEAKGVCEAGLVLFAGDEGLLALRDAIQAADNHPVITNDGNSSTPSN